MDDLPDDKKQKPGSKHSSSKHSSSNHSSSHSSSHSSDDAGVSRRDFLKISSVSAAVPFIARAGVLTAEAEELAGQSPDKLPVHLTINVKPPTPQLQPPTPLLHTPPAR